MRALVGGSPSPVKPPLERRLGAGLVGGGDVNAVALVDAFAAPFAADGLGRYEETVVVSGVRHERLGVAGVELAHVHIERERVDAPGMELEGLRLVEPLPDRLVEPERDVSDVGRKSGVGE